MNYKNKTIPFPAVTKISFSKLIDYITAQLENSDATLNQHLSLLLEECKKQPDLITGISIDNFDKEDKVIKQLCATMFPEILSQNEIKGIIPPFSFSPFYVSERFKKIIQQAGGSFQFDLNDFDEDQLYIFGCSSILSFYYKYPFLLGLPIITNLQTATGSIPRTYRILMNGDLLEIEPSEKAKEITYDDYLELLNNFDNIDLWKEKFPPDSWIMKGIGVITLLDITQTQTISNITNKLLINPLKDLNEILDDLKLFLEVEDLSMGFLKHDNDGFVEDISGLENLILPVKKELGFKNSLCAPSYERLIVQRKPIIITDVESWNQTSSCSIVSTIVENLSFGSYILIPILHNEVPLGYLELASSKTYALNGATLVKINMLLPTIGMAINRNRTELQNRKEAVIQQKFTAIHPSVKWRFEEEAVNFIKHSDDSENETYEFSDIIFPNVYALYGQMDIKDSTLKRNEAIKGDFLEQIIHVEKIIEQIWANAKTPIYEELLFRTTQFRKELEDENYSGFEQHINYFLQYQIHPLFDKLKLQTRTHTEAIEAYQAALDSEYNTFYNRRKLFDKSVAKINKVLAGFLDKKQSKAQGIFPHYFERYKTDGVEYNMYIGDSIAQKKEFSDIDLQNMQLWQLMTNCEMEFLFRKVPLEIPLEIASLILVYSTPLSVQFRIDEKRFDVAGAYNARYEIIKKRIDKAHIKGTTERLTCPGKIAIIYSNPDDATIYSRYISFLENKNYILKDSIEMLELEDLPGIIGLKAIRIAVNTEFNL